MELTLLAEAEAARSVANSTGNASAMISATQFKSKLLGLLDEKLPANSGPRLVVKDVLSVRGGSKSVEVSRLE